MTPRKWELVLVGENLVRLLVVSQQVLGLSRIVTVVHTKDPIERTLGLDFAYIDAAVIWLTGSEKVGDIGSLLVAHPSVKFLFVSHESPPSVPLVRSLARAGAVVLANDESPMVTVASLVTLLCRPYDVAEG